MTRNEFEEVYKPGALFYVDNWIVYITRDYHTIFLSLNGLSYPTFNIQQDCETKKHWLVRAFDEDTHYIGNISNLDILLREIV